MDSQEKALETGAQEELTPIVEETAEAKVVEEPAAVEEPVATEEPAAEEPAAEEPERKVYSSKKEILDRIREIAHGDEALQKDEIDYLKTIFYKLHIAERDAQFKAYTESGGDPSAYQITPDPEEEAFKAEMGIIKEKRAQLFKEQEAEKAENLKKKLAIIEKIKSMVTSPEEANKSYQTFKALQQEWKEIKNVPAEKANELWRNYQLYVEQFYDLLKNDWPTSPTSSAPSTSCRNSIRNIGRQVPSTRNCVRKSGHDSKLPLPSSTSVISSTLRRCVPRKRIISHAKQRSARK